MPVSNGVNHNKWGKSHRLRTGGQPWGRVGTAPGGSEGRAVWGVGTADDSGLEVRAAGVDCLQQ